ncbi:beta-propeller fold lactonase family protein [Mycolicibacterium sphagni]|uniref:hypothetical protein n=1 Tax=Mycolicibacterium sphagni TaxID=1786 RepID=UPI0010551864|nr:hypothetical protein [Mycolicibacterium sphagni]MCV7179451.1 hypothetical protein [Mycolicibacterium sphagni]
MLSIDTTRAAALTTDALTAAPAAAPVDPLLAGVAVTGLVVVGVLAVVAAAPFVEGALAATEVAELALIAARPVLASPLVVTGLKVLVTGLDGYAGPFAQTTGTLGGIADKIGTYVSVLGKVPEVFSSFFDEVAGFINSVNTRDQKVAGQISTAISGTAKGTGTCTGATCTVSATGAVTGTVSFANGTNTYSITAAPTNGSVIVDPTTGTFTYIPTEAAQLTGTKNDSFTETATKTGAPPSSDTITVPITAAQLKVTNTINVGTFPIGVAVSPDGSDAYVTNTGGSGAQVSVIDTNPADTTTYNTVVTNIPITASNGNPLSNPDPYGVAVSTTGNDVYVTDVYNGTVSIIDTATNAVTNVPVGNGNPTGPTADSPLGVTTSSTGQAYVANQGGESVTSINTTTNAVGGPVASFPGLNGNYGPVGVAVSPNGQQLYITVTEPPTGGGNSPGEVEVVNTATNSVVANVQVGVGPDGVAVSPTGSLAYVVNEDGNTTSGTTFNGTVSVINTATNQVTKTINVGGQPEGVAFSPDGSLAYVTETYNGDPGNADYNGTTVVVIDTATNEVIGNPITVGTNPLGVAVAPNGTAYVTNGLGNDSLVGTVSVISLVG